MRGWQRCRGEQRSPGQSYAATKPRGRTLCAPTTRLKPPLCKGRWHGVSRDGGIVILRGQVDFLARSQSPTAYRRSPSGPGPSVAARHLPTLWGVTLYTRGPLDSRVGVCEVARADMESAPTEPTHKVGTILFYTRRGTFYMLPCNPAQPPTSASASFTTDSPN